METALILMPFSEEEKERLKRIAQERCALLFYSDQWSVQQYQDALAIADMIVGDPAAEDLRCCRQLKWMQTSWAGVDGYLADGIFPENAMLCNMTGGYGPIIAEHQMGMILALCRRLPEYQRQQKAHDWKILLYEKPLEDAAVLIVGAGDIGTQLAKRLRPTVKRIVGVRRIVRAYPECYDEMITLEELDAYLPQADVVACSLPATSKTGGLFDKRRLLLMKPDAILTNVGRGSLIRLDELYEVLESGHLWGVGLDVTSPEPLPPEHPLWNQPRVILTPHVSGNSYAPGSPTERRIHGFMLENLRRYLDGEICLNQVDFTTGYRKME